MRYLSIYRGCERNTPPSEEEMARMGTLIEKSIAAGTLIATEGCLPSSKGARVRINADGGYKVVDGPFTEAKEIIGGFAILNAKSKEHAIEMVKEFLSVVGEGECEIREIYEAPAFDSQSPSASANVGHRQQESAAR